MSTRPGWAGATPFPTGRITRLSATAWGLAARCWTASPWCRELTTEDGKTICFYMLIPAYKEEIEYKLKYGMEGLSQRFAEGKLPVVLDVHRPNFCEDFKEILD